MACRNHQGHYVASKISLPKIEAANVDVHVVMSHKTHPLEILITCSSSRLNVSCGYPKGVAYLCLYQLQCMCLSALRFSHYIAIDNEVMIK